MEAEKHLQNIQQVRKLLEQSSRFSYISGIAGMLAGIFSLITVLIAAWLLGVSLWQPHSIQELLLKNGQVDTGLLLKLIALFATLLVLALGTAIILSAKKAKKAGLLNGYAALQQLLLHAGLPLLTGGIFCLILLYQQQYWLVLPATLIFYGLALLAASKFTILSFKPLGLWQITVGLLAMIWQPYSLQLWAVGFGLLHIIYGFLVFIKYEK
ncbi:MAG: hypothetical protein ACOVNR_06425 [Chitinophagaceae bacterium]